LFSNEALNIEKKLRVEDYRLLRQRFNRSSADSATLSNHPNDKATSKKYDTIIDFFFFNYYLGVLNKEEFIGAFESILDQNEYKQLLEKLFDKVSRKKSFVLKSNSI
jgi:hypothetical protein